MSTPAFAITVSKPIQDLAPGVPRYVLYVDKKQNPYASLAEPLYDYVLRKHFYLVQSLEPYNLFIQIASLVGIALNSRSFVVYCKLKEIYNRVDVGLTYDADAVIFATAEVPILDAFEIIKPIRSINIQTP